MEFGANFIAPDVTFGDEGEEHIKNAKSYHPEEDLGPVNAMQNFLNRSFNRVGMILEEFAIQKMRSISYAYFLKKCLQKRRPTLFPIRR